MGHRGAAAGAPWSGSSLAGGEAAQLHVPLPLGEALCRILPLLLRTDAEGLRVARSGWPGGVGEGSRGTSRTVEHFGRRDARRALRVSRGCSRQALMALVAAASFRELW